MPTALVDQEAPLSCDLDISLQSKTDTSQGQEDMEGLDDEVPLKNINKMSRSSLKSKSILMSVYLAYAVLFVCSLFL